MLKELSKVEGNANCVAFHLPIPPSLNKYHAVFNDRIVLTKEARDYRNRVAWIVTNSAVLSRITAFSTPVRVSLDVHLTQADASRDLDNFQKGLLDSLVDSQILSDDSIVFDLHMRKKFYDINDNRKGCVKVFIETI